MWNDVEKNGFEGEEEKRTCKNEADGAAPMSGREVWTRRDQKNGGEPRQGGRSTRAGGPTWRWRRWSESWKHSFQTERTKARTGTGGTVSVRKKANPGEPLRITIDLREQEPEDSVPARSDSEARSKGRRVTVASSGLVKRL